MELLNPAPINGNMSQARQEKESSAVWSEVYSLTYIRELVKTSKLLLLRFTGMEWSGRLESTCYKHSRIRKLRISVQDGKRR